MASERKEASVDGWASNFLSWKAKLASQPARLALSTRQLAVAC